MRWCAKIDKYLLGDHHYAAFSPSTWSQALLIAAWRSWLRRLFIRSRGSTGSRVDASHTYLVNISSYLLCQRIPYHMRYDQLTAWPVLKLHVHVTKFTRPLNQGGMVTTFGVSPVALLWQPLTDYLCRGDHNKSLHWDDKFAQREKILWAKTEKKDQSIKGRHQSKKVFFRALQASPNPPSHDPNWGNLVLFFQIQDCWC